MRLYFIPGACSLASHIILREVGADFRLIRVDGATKLCDDGSDYRRINPNGYVPALRLSGGEILTENPAVLTYLAGLRPELSLGPDEGALALARFNELLAFLSSELHKAFSPFFAQSALKGTAKEAASARLASRIDHIERLLSDGRDYLLPGGFTAADAFAFVILGWTPHTGLSLDRWPAAGRFVERIGQRPCVKAAMAAEGLRVEAA